MTNMHSHKHSNREKNIKVAILLNVSFTIIEIIGGLWTNSLAILSDALHDFGDSIALITSLMAENHIEHSTIELESKRYCSEIDCK